MSNLPVTDSNDDFTPLYTDLSESLWYIATKSSGHLRIALDQARDAINNLDTKCVNLLVENDKLGFKNETLTLTNENLVKENEEIHVRLAELEEKLEQQKDKFAQQREELVIQEKAIQKVARQLQQQAFNPKSKNKVSRVRELLSLPKRPLLCHKHQNLYQLPKHPRFGVQLLSVKKNAF